MVPREAVLSPISHCNSEMVSAELLTHSIHSEPPEGAYMISLTRTDRGEYPTKKILDKVLSVVSSSPGRMSRTENRWLPGEAGGSLNVKVAKSSTPKK